MSPFVFIITSHPFTHSFNFALREQAIKTFEKANWQILQSNLHQQPFKADILPCEITDELISQYGSVSQLQQQAQASAILRKDIIAEHKKLIAAELVILQFPLWWGGMPGLLKSWIDKVMTYGFAYGDKFAFEGKKVMLSVTTGGARDIEEQQYYLNKVTGISDDIFKYLKMEVIAPFICHGPAAINLGQREEMLAKYAEYLNRQITYLE